MSEDKQYPHVIIAGGGPGGLLASILLSKAGIESTVVERAAEADPWSSRSYTIVLNDKGKESLARGGCLEAATKVCSARHFVYLVDGKTGDQKRIPKQSLGLGFTRPLLVECLEKMVDELPNVTIRRGVGVFRIITDNDNAGLQVQLEDDTLLSATHVIGADGKWSKVRQSFTSLESQATMVTCPSFGVSMVTSFVPEGWETDGTYVIKPADECMFHIVVSPLPENGLSLSMVCYDETIEKYPWLAPPVGLTPRDYGRGDWKDEYAATSSTEMSDIDLAGHLGNLFQKEIPAFYAAVGKETLRTARINRKVTWLQMSATEDGTEVSYSTEDGRVALIGDAAHVMPPTLGEGCNTALESAVKLADAIIWAMKENGETSCTIDTMGKGFARYGVSRPKEAQPIQDMSAARCALANSLAK